MTLLSDKRKKANFLKQLRNLESIFCKLKPNIYPLGNLKYFEGQEDVYRDALPNLRSISGYTREFSVKKEGEAFERPMLFRGRFEPTDDVRASVRYINQASRGRITIRGEAPEDSHENELLEKMIEAHRVSGSRAATPCREEAARIQKDFNIFDISGYIAQFSASDSENKFKDLPYDKLKILKKRLEDLRSVCTPKLFKDNQIFIELLQAESFAELEDRIQFIEAFINAENVAYNFGVCARIFLDNYLGYVERCAPSSNPKKKDKLLSVLRKTSLSRADLAAAFSLSYELPFWGYNKSHQRCVIPSANNEIFCNIADLAQDKSRYPEAILHGKVQAADDSACEGLKVLNEESALLKTISCNPNDQPKIYFRGWHSHQSGSDGPEKNSHGKMDH